MVKEVAAAGTLEHIFQQILIISKGTCEITDEMLAEVTDEHQFNVLSGLQMLHEDLALYKAELKAKMEAEFQLEVLKKRNEELAQFNFIASHDLQEPLRTIQSFSGLLIQENENELNESGKLYLNFIKESANRMSKLISGLLNYSRIGKSIVYESVDCTLLMKNIIDDLDYTIQKTNPILIIDKLPTVYADKIGLRQIFQNLTSNALKFRKNNQPIQLKISVKKVDQEYIFCFEDNGIGMEAAYLTKIFGIFQRLNSKTEFSGTGIGLAICKKIAEMHNGRIWATSTINVGTKFYLVLPVASIAA